MASIKQFTGCPTCGVPVNENCVPLEDELLTDGVHPERKVAANAVMRMWRRIHNAMNAEDDWEDLDEPPLFVL